MAIDLKSNMKSNIKKESEIAVSNTNVNGDIKIEEQGIKTFRIGKKKENKIEKKPFPLYVDGSVQKELDKIVKKTGYSRNELINMMISHCLDNLEFTD